MKIIILFGVFIAVLNVQAAGRKIVEVQISSESTEVKKADSSSSKVYTFVDQQPEFPGGEGELVKRLNVPTPYGPNSGITGRLIVKFVVNEDGSVSDATGTQSSVPILNPKAINLVNALPKFIPGKKDGKNVKVYNVVPVWFR